jgi:TRAP-type C4-dicarboxylate transport system substrate-binding protein
MKKRSVTILMIVLVIGALMAGCGTEASTETSAPAAPATSAATTASTAATTATTAAAPDTTTAAPPAKVIELKFGSHIPAQGGTYEVLKQWAAKVEEATRGAVKITLYMSGSLVSSDFASSCAAGICDIVMDPFMYEPTWKLQQVVLLPSVQFPDGVIGSKALAQLHEKFPILNESYEGVHPLFFNVGIAVTGVHTKKPVRVPADIEDMKIATTSEQEQDILLGAGAVPLVMPSPDWYMSIDRNLAEGILGPYVVTFSLGVNDLLPNHLRLNLGPAGAGVYLINSKVWDSFTPEIKQSFEECNTWLIAALEESDHGLSEMIYGKIKESGGTIVDPTEAEAQEWLALTTTLSQKWIDANKDLGPTQEIYDYVTEMLKQPEFQKK